MEFSEILRKRTSVRSYTGESVTEEQMYELLKAAVRAPNACNYQSWHFYAVCDKNLINGFDPDIANIPWIKDIPLLIVICIDENTVGVLQDKFGEQRGRMFAYQDAAGAANLILLKAVELGLGGCWIGPIDVERCKSHLSIKSDHFPAAILTIGVPSAELPIRDRKPLNEAVTVIGNPYEKSTFENSSDEADKPFSLAHASLPNSVFDDLNLSDASFNNINLQDAEFNDINLAKAKFRNISFENAVFEYCDIEGMTIDGINVKKAIKAMQDIGEQT